MPISQNLNKTWNSEFSFCTWESSFFCSCFPFLPRNRRVWWPCYDLKQEEPISEGFRSSLGILFLIVIVLAKLRLCEGLPYLTLVSHQIIARHSAADYQCLAFKFQSFFFTLRNSKGWSKLTQFSASSRKKNCIKMKYGFV